jgi:hypothetical protein
MIKIWAKTIKKAATQAAFTGQKPTPNRCKVYNRVVAQLEHLKNQNQISIMEFYRIRISILEFWLNNYKSI